VVGEGRIIGIRVRSEHRFDDTDWRIDEYAVEVAADEPFVVGVRQHLDPVDLVRLGMPVALRHDGARAVIDWAGTCGGGVGEASFLDEAPPPGIDDATLTLDEARMRGAPVRVRIGGVSVTTAMGGLLRAVVLDVVVVGGPRAGGRARLPIGPGAPFYASHLPRVGAELPAWIEADTPERPAIDWPAAAVADPGVGRPPVSFSD
jgi:hypothetical protein